MKTPELKLPQPLVQLNHQVQDYLAKLQPRERLAVIGLVVFLSLFLPVYLAWIMHTSANQREQDAVQQREQLIKMYSLAPRITVKTQDNMPFAQRLQNLAQQQGLTVALNDDGAQVKLTANHKNYAVLANFIMQIVQAGATVVEMNWKRLPTGEIALSAVVKN